MYILSFKEGHDPAACLLKDGKIIAAVEEERFTRQKHAPGLFPEQAIKFCLDWAHIKEEDVDYLAYARFKPWKTFWKVAIYYLAHPPLSRLKFRYFISHIKVQILGTWQEIRGKANYQKIHKLFPGLPKKIYHFEHHLCHTASAYYFSPFEESLIITLDGKGEATSVMIAEGKGKEIKIIERKGLFQSLGLFYSSITEYLGFTPNDGEYKVMGLAPYGKPDLSKFADILSADETKGYKLDTDFVLYPLSEKNLIKKFGPKRGREDELNQNHKDFAASVQESLELAGVSLVKYALKKVKTKNLCLAGGVALNVKMNRRIWESGLVEKMFIQPVAGDNGNVLGAAALLYKQKTNKRVEPLHDLYLGPEFSNEEIRNVLENKKMSFHYTPDPEEEAAKLVAAEKVVGWYQGRMEYGPRALGNRSILAHPGVPGMKSIVNRKIKFREGFRPFCPSMLEEKASDFLAHYTTAPFMITSFKIIKDEVAERMPSVVHVDGTVRPQGVESKINPKYYNLINKFYQLTGLPVVLNTSMNVRGEPIVCTPEDAVKFFVRTHADALVIGNYVLLKEEQDPSVLEVLPETGLDTKY